MTERSFIQQNLLQNKFFSGKLRRFCVHVQRKKDAFLKLFDVTWAPAHGKLALKSSAELDSRNIFTK
eukprot:5711775-Amphidinium_carterae.2